MSGYSSYFDGLQKEHPAVAQHYQEKLKIINGIDPFAILEDMNFTPGPELLPPITSMDIVAYLVLSHSFYTKEQMKAYKSLSAFKYFESGFVQKLGVKKINNKFVMAGQVSVI